MRKLLLIVSLFLVTMTSWAQEKTTVSGVVSDASLATLPGVSVVEKGTTNGTATDIDGKFMLTVSDGNAVLVFSFVGYKTQEVPVSGKTQLNITLNEDVEVLDEVVVTGYGSSQKRATLTTSISKMDNKALENIAVANAAAALQGSVSGLRVINTSGQPGSDPKIILRGGATISNDPNGPLVIVDGIVRSMADVNPADIESIQVLKDAASTAIYGARANSGVILVTTKTGKAGHSEISYRFKAGLNYARKGYDFLDAHDYLYYNRLGNKYAGRSLEAVNSSNGYGTSRPDVFSVQYLTDENKHLLSEGWKQMTDPYDGSSQLLYQDFGGKLMDAAFNDPSFTHDHTLSFTGGSDQATFFASIGYYSEEGQISGTKYERFNGSLNASYKIKPTLTLNGGVTFTYSEKPGLWVGESDIFYRSLSLWPTWNPYDEEGNPLAGSARGEFGDGNPLYWLEKLQRKNGKRKTTFNIGAAWEILPNKLTLKESSSIYYVDYLTEDFNKAFKLQVSETVNDLRKAKAYYEKQWQQQHNLTLEYNDTYQEDHHINVLLGGEYFDYKLFQLEASGQGAPSDDVPTLNASSERTNISSNHSQYRILSLFGRANYDYKYRYLLSVVARYDGISKLTDNRWGFFPGVSAGWNVHEEEFFKNSRLADYISTVKPRVSYGVNGNVAGIGDYTTQGLYEFQAAYNQNTGFLNTSVVNNRLKWEKSKSFEVGLDLGFFDNRLNFILDYYNRKTDDLLTDLNLPGYTGFDSYKTNLGTLRNSGFEVELKANIIRNVNDFNWDISANASYVKNKIIKLPYNGNKNNRQGGFEVYDPATGGNVWKGGYQEGQGLGDIYAYKQERIFRSEADILENAADRYDAVAELYGPEAWAALTNKNGKKQIEPGDVMWADLNNDHVIDGKDRVKVGNIFPDWTGGFSTNFSWKNLSLYARFDFTLGHTIFNGMRAGSLGQYQGTFNVITDVYDMWTPENPNANLPKFYYADQLSKKNITRSNNGSYNLNNNNSEFYEKGDYLALREITLSYKLGKRFLEKFRMNDISVYVTGQNLAYFTGYSGSSPEPVVGGVDLGRYPLPKTLLFGLQFAF